LSFADKIWCRNWTKYKAYSVNILCRITSNHILLLQQVSDLSWDLNEFLYKSRRSHCQLHRVWIGRFFSRIPDTLVLLKAVSNMN
jgi:hypothetical protein